jgi:hypothetical protein
MAQLGCVTEKARDDIGKSVSNWKQNVKSCGFVTSCFSVSYSIEPVSGIPKTWDYVANVVELLV